MLDRLIEFTALPNLHPAVVHFPIACLPLALAFDVAALTFRRQYWLLPAAATLYVFGALSAWLAVWAGEKAADGLIDVAATVQPRIGEHSDWAHYALYSLIVIAAARLAIQLRPRLRDNFGARLGVLVLGLVVLGVLGKAADLGGALVYEHALAVKPAVVAMPAASTDEPSGEAESSAIDSARDRLLENEDGSLVWRPAPGDRDALGSVVTAAPGSELGAVRTLDPGDGGLLLAVDSPTTLLLPGTFGDVQVEAEIEMLDFQGSISLVHHFHSDSHRGSFELSSDGTAVLDDAREGNRKVLDQKEAEAPGGIFVLAVSASGKHLKGLIDGRMVTHGHIAPGPEGSCGLRLDGNGTLRLLRMTVQPLEGQ